eukprot:1158416-Pelagomonas_calceolata.AAC.4
MASEPAKGDPFAASVQERMPYYLKRIQLFEQYAANQRARIEEARQANQEITLTLPDGKQRKAIKNVTTPQEVAKEISSGLAKKVVVAEVDGQPWDLARPLEADCAIKLYGFDDPEGKDVMSKTIIERCLVLTARARLLYLKWYSLKAVLCIMHKPFPAAASRTVLECASTLIRSGCSVVC